MRRIRKVYSTVLALCATAWLVGGCYIASIHPLAAPSDRFFDKDLQGVWAHGRDTLNFSGEDVENMHLEVSEGAGLLTDSLRKGGLEMLCTRIEDQNYLDVWPGDLLKSNFPTLKAMLLVPMHGFLRYSIVKDTLKVESLNYKEFSDRMRKGKWHGLELEALADDGPLLITSPTAKIRKFIASREDEGLYAEPTLYVRVR
jgi:hypothetical protein